MLGARAKPGRAGRYAATAAVARTFTARPARRVVAAGVEEAPGHRRRRASQCVAAVRTGSPQPPRWSSGHWSRSRGAGEQRDERASGRPRLGRVAGGSVGPRGRAHEPTGAEAVRRRSSGDGAATPARRGPTSGSVSRPPTAASALPPVRDRGGRGRPAARPGTARRTPEQRPARPAGGRTSAVAAIGVRLLATHVAVHHYAGTRRVDQPGNAHLGPSGRPTSCRRCSTFASYGWIGVEIFFVISGFVICMSCWGRTPRQFFVVPGDPALPGVLVRRRRSPPPS